MSKGLSYSVSLNTLQVYHLAMTQRHIRSASNYSEKICNTRVLVFLEDLPVMFLKKKKKSKISTDILTGL